LLWSVVGISWFWLVGALFQMALILAGKEMLHTSEVQSGLLIAALAVGIGIGSVVAGALSGDHIELGLVPVGSLLMGISSVAFGSRHNFSSAIVWLICVGFGGGLFVVPLNAYLQEHAGRAEKGRILATNNFANMVGVILSSGLIWVLHDLLQWNAGVILVALGLVMVAGTVGVISLIPEVSIRFILCWAAKGLFRINIEGLDRMPREGGAILVANHVSFVDSILLANATPRLVRFLMWRPFYEKPVVHSLFRILRAIPVSAGSPKENATSIETARKALLNGELIGIFPEGHITRDGSVDRFNRGFERIAEGIDIPIIPIHIDGLFGHPFSYKNGGLLRSWEHFLRPHVTLRIGDPITASISPEALREVVVDLSSACAA
jgi:acyl-[acyl-carrier-protein]-phospholipid O-acyltransferase / long-chain-fatty-acid--[acyl-carrier-protein] ligase